MTRTGWSVTAFGSAMLMVGLLGGLSVATVIGAAALVLVVMAWLMARFPVRMSGTLSLDAYQVTVGDTAVAWLEIRNDGRRYSPPLWGHLDALGETVPFAIPALAPGTTQVIELPLPTRRRAAGSVGPVKVTSGDPLRLSRRAITLGRSHDFYVHPRRLPTGWQHQGLTQPLDGSASGGLQSDLLSFAGLRAYTPGDDIRLVHWPTVARTADLVVRRTLDLSPQRLDVLLDVRSDRWDEARFEHGVSIAASLIEAAQAAGVPWGLLTGTDRFTGAGRSLVDLSRVLNWLAGVQTTSDTGTLDVTSLRTASVIVITGSASPLDHEALAVLANRAPSVTVVELADEFGRTYAPASHSVAVVRVGSLEQFSAEWGR